jgi:hypothetical protein
VADGSVEDARSRYRKYLDTKPLGAYGRFELDELLPLDTFRDRARARLENEPDVDGLEVIYLGESVGFTTRGKLAAPDATAGAGFGDSQGATLPGESTGYRVVWFRCVQHRIWVPASCYDPRRPPECPRGSSDVMEYVHEPG